MSGWGVVYGGNSFTILELYNYVTEHCGPVLTMVNDKFTVYLSTFLLFFYYYTTTTTSSNIAAVAVLLAQLRNGHCHKLAAYHNVIDPTADPACRRCNFASHTLEHWLVT